MNTRPPGHFGLIAFRINVCPPDRLQLWAQLPDSHRKSDTLLMIRMLHGYGIGQGEHTLTADVN